MSVRSHGMLRINICTDELRARGISFFVVIYVVKSDNKIKIDETKREKEKNRARKT